MELVCLRRAGRALLCLAALFSAVAPAAGGTATFGFRKQITIDFNQVAGASNHTDFPVLVSLTDADLRTVSNGGRVENANGFDIVFTAADGTTRLDFDVETYDGLTGTLIAWVKVPTLLVASNTILFIHYGSTDIFTPQETPSSVWTAGYAGVWHLNEVGAGNLAEFRDGSPRANHGIGGNGDPLYFPDRISGKIGFAQYFDRLYTKGDATVAASSTTVTFANCDACLPTNVQAGDTLVLDPGGANEETFTVASRDSATQVTVTVAAASAHSAEAYELFDVDNKNDMINVGDDPSLDITGDQITLEAWIRHDITPDFGQSYGFLNHKGFGNGYRFHIQQNSLNLTFELTSPDSLTSAGTVSANTWHHVVATYDGATMKIYMDGVQDANTLAKTGGIDSVPPQENDVWIGHGDQPVDRNWSYPWEGDIDEVRISTVARDADWITTEFNNQDSPGTFYAVGGEQAGSYALATFDVNYRSIGGGGQIYNTGQAAVSLGSRTVTFSGATLPTNIGLGDKLVLDPLGGNTETLFILSRDSATQVTLQTRATLDHSTPEDYSIERAWDTFQNWENARDGNLVTEYRREIGVAYNDAPFQTPVQFSGATTDPERFMMLTVAPVHRHSGVAGTGAVLQPNVAGDTIVVQSDYTRVEWLEITGWPGASDDGVRIQANHTQFRYLLVHDGGDGASDGFRLSENSGSWTARIENTITYNMGRGCYAATNDSGTFDLVFVLENVTAYGCGWGGNFAAGGINACQTTSNTTTVHARNVLAVGNLDGEGDADADFNINDRTAACDATPSWGISDFNITTDATAPGPNSITGIAAAGEFVDTTASSEDLHLTSGANAIDAADFSLKIANDIDLQSRVGLAAWDVGADELGATTAVRLASFAAAPGDGEVALEWRTASELDNLGFHLYRATSRHGPFERITDRLIPGLGSSPEGARYHYRDADLQNGLTYYYELEDIETSGVTERHGPVEVTPEAGSESPAGPELAEADAALVYGRPDEIRLLDQRRGPRTFQLTLHVGGFRGGLAEDGSLRLEVPELGTENGLPLLRHWVDAVPRRSVEIVSIRPQRVRRFSGIRVAAGEGFELVANRKGVVRLRRRTRGRVRGSALPWARVVTVGYQGQKKRALVELSPFHWDSASGELLFAERLVVTLSFRKPDSSDGASRRRMDERHVVVRLGATDPGLYAVSFEDVFGNTRRRAAPVSKLRLSRRGDSVPYQLKPRRDEFRPGSTLYFVSEGAQLNPFGREAVYELEWGRPGEEMELVTTKPHGKPVPFLWHRIAFERDRYYQAGLVDAPDVWLWEVLFAPDSKPFPFSVRGLAAAPEAARITVRLQGVSDSAEAPDHHVRALVNGYLVGELRWDGKLAATLEGMLPPGILHDGENVLEVDNVGDTEAPHSMVMLDGFEVVYPRVDGGSGVAPSDGVVSLTGFPGGAFVVDVTSDTPRWLSHIRRRGDRIDFRAESDHDYVTVASEAVRRPSIQRPRFSLALDAARSADYLVIAPDEFLATIEPLLELRRNQGLNAVAVSAESVFDVFGYGERDPLALRELLRDVYHPALRYVVLVGDGNYDFKNQLDTGDRNWIPPLLVRTSYLWTASDPGLALVHGDDGLPDVAIGRLPAKTVEDVETMVAKILAYETESAPRERSVVLVADDADEAGDFERDADELSATTLSGRPVRKVYLSRLGPAGTREQILQSFDEGAGLVSYAGHGAIHLWADENVFNTRDIEALSPQSEQPLVLTLNCLNGYFHFPYFDSLAEALVKKPNKGAIAAISPSGLSLNEPAHTLHRALLHEILHGGHARLGDALLAAQDAYVSTGHFPELLDIFHLFGDPALRLR